MRKIERDKTIKRFRAILLDDLDVDTFEPEFLKVDAGGRLNLRGVERVEVYEKEKIILSQKGKKLLVEGFGLVISVLSVDVTVIEGDFSSIRWLEKEGDK